MLLPRLRLRARVLILGFSAVSVLLWIILPYDNAFVLFIRWHLNTVFNHFKVSKIDRVLLEPPVYPLEADDIGLIVKTGFSTQERLLARLDAFEHDRNQSNVVLVGDYATQQGAHFTFSGQQMPVYDVLAWMLDSGYLSSRPSSPRLLMYSNLTAAIASGRTDLARENGESIGWELDIMKHISGLDYGYRQMPNKRWYIMLDDDTYLLEPSLELVLGHLDSNIPYYIGNAIGDYKGRFAHGGSAIVFSQAAMHRLFVQNPELISAAYLESLTARWGDKLIATTAMKAGIYVKEQYRRHFSGEEPRHTHIQSDRFCVPIVSFHKMAPSEMMEVGRIFKNISTPVAWIDLWSIYQAPSFRESSDDHPVRSNWDHVGRLDESTTSTNSIETKEACLELCYSHISGCLAWTWEADKSTCHISPWMTIGDSADGKFSGINVPCARRLLDECQLYK
ncbi:MAG: hypothetical protein M1818_001383 [Claussenomyces sp. TS43310]|nr:MAG: hypothetical protein M1818_001383 [Claussenomyces sp. TS43310]